MVMSTTSNLSHERNVDKTTKIAIHVSPSLFRILEDYGDVKTNPDKVIWRILAFATHVRRNKVNYERLLLSETTKKKLKDLCPPEWTADRLVNELLYHIERCNPVLEE